MIDGSPRCYALFAAIREDMELARFLIAHGANINAVNERGTSVLSFALKFRPEFAQELRTLGAKETHELPGYKPKHAIVQMVEQRLCAAYPLSWLAVVPEEVPVSIHTVFHLEHYCLFTSGMSDRAMTVPPGGETYQYAELVLYINVLTSLPSELEETDPFDWSSFWLVKWMFRIARLPFQQHTWLEGKWTIISNEEPPQPLSEYTAMTCWLLLGEKEPLARAELPDGKSVCFYTMMPLHTAERDLALREGLVALLQRFEEQYVSVELNPNRPSVV